MAPGQIFSRENAVMGHISDLPRDVIWLILRHVMYADYFYPKHWICLRHLMNGGTRPMMFDLPVNNSDYLYLIHVVRRYARVSRQWLDVARSKMRRVTCENWTGWKFTNGAWTNFKP
jgi:hypothetical protein